jgi:predicted unusual protein kinase regulating ubiquinone biosynthesis (AarF/ABC1/UbiB family)
VTSSTARIHRGLIQATLHLVNREYAALADDFITLGLLPPGSDRAAIVPALTGVFQVSAGLCTFSQSLAAIVLSAELPRAVQAPSSATKVYRGQCSDQHVETVSL